MPTERRQSFVMLQINTGKLFTRGVGRTNVLRGVLYSNGELPFQRGVTTGAGAIHSAGWRDISGGAWIYEVEERIEKPEDGPGVLVSHTVAPFLRDFSVVASFGLKVIVSQDSESVRLLTGDRAGFASTRLPRQLVQRYFNAAVYLHDEDCAAFATFVDELLALERKAFLAAMRSMRSFAAALHALTDDLGLAYTLLVTSVESLARGYTVGKTHWDEVDSGKRERYDFALEGAGPDVTAAVRDVVASLEHPQLSRRYRAFALNSIDHRYFREGAALEGRPVGRLELPEALSEAYSIRSRYIHGLRRLHDNLSIAPSDWEVTSVDRRPVLTFQGLVRLSHHVIRRFVETSPKIERQAYHYSGEQPGIVAVEMAPQYWIWAPLRDASDARRRLEGLLEQVAQVRRGDADAAITDLRTMLAEVVALLPSASAKHRPALYALYALFNGLVEPDCRCDGYQTVLDVHGTVCSGASSEILAARTMLDNFDDWPLNVHREAFDRYWAARWKRDALHAPRFVEAAMALALAERCREDGDKARCETLLDHALDNHPACGGLKAFVDTYAGEGEINWQQILCREQVPETLPL